MLLSLAAFAAAFASCNRTQTDEAPRESASAQDLIKQADGLYAERASIEKARQAVAVLRRARMADYGNYEAIWKLSKYDYYLGAHETGDQQQLEAFREGIAAGEQAVKLAPGKRRDFCLFTVRLAVPLPESGQRGGVRVPKCEPVVVAQQVAEAVFQAGARWRTGAQPQKTGVIHAGGDVSSKVRDRFRVARPNGMQTSCHPEQDFRFSLGGLILAIARAQGVIPQRATSNFTTPRVGVFGEKPFEGEAGRFVGGRIAPVTEKFAGRSVRFGTFTGYFGCAEGESVSPHRLKCAYINIS